LFFRAFIAHICIFQNKFTTCTNASAFGSNSLLHVWCVFPISQYLKKKILLDAPHSFVTTIDAFSLLCSLCLSLSLINYKYQQVNHQRPNKKRTITTIMKLTSALLSSLLLATGTCGRQCTFILNCMTAIGFR
jgi:hypothetical protein